MELSVNDAAEFFGVSKEAIHNRIRRGSLEVVVSNGVKMVVVDEREVKQTPSNTKLSRPKMPPHDERYYRLLEEQNAQLQKRVERLEDETRSLRDQKEQLLIAEKQKIEAIYKEKDEQLKNILSTLSQQFMHSLAPTAKEEVAIDAEIEQSTQVSNIVSLKKFLKSLKLTDKESKQLKNEVKKIATTDKRFVLLGEKIYLDTLRYDYSDLL